MLESVTKAFDGSKLSSFIDVADPLVSGVESLLGMSDVELRMGMYRHLDTPGGQRDESQTLRPGFQVMINAPQDIDAREQKKFRFADGRLWYDDGQGGRTEYRQADFIVVHFVPLQSRPDYTTFDFHKVFWPKVVDHIWNGHQDAARQALRLLAANLVQSQDITEPQRNRLLAMYRKKFEDEMANHRLFEDEGAGQGFEQDRSALSEDDLHQAVQSDGTPANRRQPEAVLAELDF